MWSPSLTRVIYEYPTCDEACWNARGLIGDVAVMETLRLRALQQPVHTERLLEAFATRANIVPRNSYRIRDPDALPLTLQRVMFDAAQEGCIWVCWARGSHSWLFTSRREIRPRPSANLSSRE